MWITNTVPFFPSLSASTASPSDCCLYARTAQHRVWPICTARRYHTSFYFSLHAPGTSPFFSSLSLFFLPGYCEKLRVVCSQVSVRTFSRDITFQGSPFGKRLCFRGRWGGITPRDARRSGERRCKCSIGLGLMQLVRVNPQGDPKLAVG